MRLFLASGILLASVTAATADWQAGIRWCETETSAPKKASCIAQKMPDGNRRGTRSAATLIGEARGAARAGNRNGAFDWALACECHDSNAQNEFRAARDALVDYLAK
jgi:hypothetical protein